MSADLNAFVILGCMPKEAQLRNKHKSWFEEVIKDYEGCASYEPSYKDIPIFVQECLPWEEDWLSVIHSDGQDVEDRCIGIKISETEVASKIHDVNTSDDWVGFQSKVDNAKKVWSEYFKNDPHLILAVSYF